LKTVYYLFATFIFLLAIKPGVDAMGLYGTDDLACCGEYGDMPCEEESDDSCNEQKTCEGEVCNPFEVCGSCTLACQPTSLMVTPQTIVLLPITIPTRFEFYSLFTVDFWQPPKLI